MAETTELNIILSAKGGDAAASDIKKPAKAIDDLKKGHKDLQTRFSERFSAVALDLYTKDALRAAGMGSNLEKVLGTLNFAMVGLGNSIGFLTSKMGLYVTAAATVVGILMKLRSANQEVKVSLQEQLDAQIKAGDEVKKTTDLFTGLHGVVAYDLTPAMNEYEASIRRVNAANNAAQIATVNKQIDETTAAVNKAQKAYDDAVVSFAGPKPGDSNWGDYASKLDAVKAKTSGASFELNKQKENMQALNDVLVKQKANLEALQNGYSTTTEYLKSLGEQAKKTSTDALDAEKKQMAEDEKAMAAETKRYAKMVADKKKLDDDAAAHYKAVQKKQWDADKQNLNESISRYQSTILFKRAMDEDEQAHYDELLKMRAENYKSTVDTISTLASSGNKTLSAIGKAASVSSAYISTYEAANKALASAPPPINYALAAAVVAAGISNVSKIMSYATGTDQLVSNSTLMRVGENGTERVTVTPIGAGGRPITQQWATNNNQSATHIGSIHLHVEGGGAGNEDRMFRKLISRIRGQGDLGMVRG